MSSDIAIGIDLGTTLSCAAVYKNGKLEVIPNRDGNRLTPSIVFFDPKTGEVFVGKTADQKYPKCAKNGISDAKRFIGRKYEDAFISRYVKSHISYLSIVKDQNGLATFKIEVSGKKIIKKPGDISGEVLKHIKGYAERYLGVPVTKAVISIPAYFSSAQRKATKKAAELAGLTVLRLITEPTAAAIHYVSEKNRANSNIMVVDLGGGTFDISLIKVKNDTFEVKAVMGDPLLGGKNFDEALVNHFYNKIDGLKDNKFTTMKFKRRLTAMCEELKVTLSTIPEFSVFIDAYDGENDLELEMTRDGFEKLTEHLYQRIHDIILICLDDSGFSKSDVDEVVLVGGSTRIPRIKELLASIFGKGKIKTDLNPDEAVAAGAGKYAAMLCGNDRDAEHFKVTEVTPMSLGTNIYGDVMRVFLPKNSPLPKKVSRTFSTASNDQSAMEIVIYEGERKNVKFNNELGEISIKGLPEGKAGDVQVTVTFTLNEDGILDVKAHENTAGIEKKLVLTMGEFRLSNKKITASIEDARKHKAEDTVFEEFSEKKVSMQKQCHRVLYDLEKISPENKKIFVKDSCNTFLKESDNLKFNRIAKLKTLYAELKNDISGIVRECLNYQLE